MRSGAEARSRRSRGEGVSGRVSQHRVGTCAFFWSRIILPEKRSGRARGPSAARNRARHAGARDAAAIVACGLSGRSGCRVTGSQRQGLIHPCKFWAQIL
uniref:zinc finger protein 287 isoform X2 n=1 Tax=Ictidomys tridecemlineatus TaxID=43179 RepID=UPI001A9DBE1E|nr:zinc finger protein 287 isoform X2 [Ictidomys tridecemlineatus]